MRKLLGVKSHSWFHAKEYFIIKWTVDDSPHSWLQVDWIQTDRHFEVALFKPSPLGWFSFYSCTRVWFGTSFVSYSSPHRKHVRAIVILIRVSCHLFSGKWQISGAISNWLPVTLLLFWSAATGHYSIKRAVNSVHFIQHTDVPSRYSHSTTSHSVSLWSPTCPRM